MRDIVTRTVFLFCFLAISVEIHGQNRQPASEQTSFSEFQVSHPVALNPEIIKLLLKTAAGRQGLDFASDGELRDPSQLFVASEVHLGQNQNRALVVLGRSAMSGADNDWFWIVLREGNHARVVLWAGAYSLQLMSHRTNGLRDITTFWDTALESFTRVYKYNGKAYRLWRDKVTEKPM